MPMKRIATSICVVAFLCGVLFGQSTTGSLTGTIVDSSGAAVPGAQVQAKDLRTGAVRDSVSGPEGIFAFNSLEPDRYNLTVKASGFKAYTQSDIDITANAPRDLGKLALALGALTEEISVVAAATPVQTASSEKSALVDSAQIADLTLKGRDLFAVLQTVPGVNLGTTYLTGGDATNEGTGIGALQINGGGNERTSFMVDGVEDMDTGSDGTLHYEPTMDTIAEIRVLTTNYQAEYGRSSSGTVSVVTKGGSQEFHGTAYVNKRHEMFNATSFSNKTISHTPKSIYRFFVWGYSVGGPIYIPKHFNTQKKKLFFFFSQEYTKQKPATLSGTYGVPTTDIGANGSVISGMGTGMMQGNFYSACVAGSSPCVPGYVNGNGTNEDSQLLNPAANKAVLTGGNVNSLIGTQYYDATSAGFGQAILAFMPPPNMCTAAAGIYNGAAISPSNCPAGFTTTGISTTNNYSANFYQSFAETHPRRNDTGRLDWNITSKLSTWARWIHDYDLDDASLALAMKTSTGAWEPYTSYHPNPGHGYGVGITYTISPTTVNEFTFGKSYNTWDYYPRDDSQLSRANMGNPPSFANFATEPNYANDKGNPRPDMTTPGSLNFQVVIPGTSFGGQPTESAPSPSCGGTCPYTNYNDIYSFNDAISKVWGKHNLKAGLYIERTGKVQHDDLGSAMGAYSFGSGGAAMAADTQDGYANAYLGNMNNYTEGQRNIGNWWFTNVEYFVQDNWRVSRRLTLDLGVRFYYMEPTTNLNTGVNGEAEFYPPNYSAAAAPRIFYPACMTPGTTTVISTVGGACPAADQTAFDPTTQYKTFYSYQGALVPAAVGGYSTTPNLYDGMTLANNTSGLPMSLYTVRSVSPTPRLGFAWDVFGNGKTAVRGGVGIFLNQPDFNLIQFASEQQPVMQSRTIYYSNINSINNASIQANAAISPIAPGTDFYGFQKYESAYNGSFMIQQNLGFATVLEASWVFNLRRHIPSSIPINYSPLYAQYNPNWASPMAQYLTVPSKIGGLTQGNASGLDLSANYFYGPSLCGGCVSGFGGLPRNEFSESTDYNGLQINLRRNMTRHLSYQLAYTYSKTMGVGLGSIGDGSSGIGQSAIFPDKFRNWGGSFNPTPQVAAINYVYEAPNLGQKLHSKLLGVVTDHWTWSGITQIHSDLMYGIPGYTMSNSNGTSDPLENWTGSTGGRGFS